MFQHWRQPAAVWVAILAIGASALMPAQLLAECRCVLAAANQSGCCQLPTKAGSDCCCSPRADHTRSCCSTTATTQSAQDCCAVDDGSACVCTACGVTPATVPATAPRADAGSSIDVSFLALPIAILPAPTLVLASHLPLLPGEGYVPPPVRERFCVWTI